MSRLAPLAVVAILLMPAAGHAQVIDNDYKKIDHEYRNDYGCLKNKPPHATNGWMADCWKKRDEKYVGTGDLRGTPEYVKKRYGVLSVQELNEQIIARNRFFGQTRDFRRFDKGRQDGEVTTMDMTVEVNELRALINAKGGPGQLR